tara:strand:+ start:579 stop:794 length:216 start_codon:yes stop_codon:yes gene_type:complete
MNILLVVLTAILFTKVLPPGEILFIPPVPCQVRYSLIDYDNDKIADEIRMTIIKPCKYIDKLKKKNMVKKF